MLDRLTSLEVFAKVAAIGSLSGAGTVTLAGGKSLTVGSAGDSDFSGKISGGSTASSLVKTGERSYCLIGEWDSLDALVKARPTMIGVLDTFRADLEDLGGGLGATDPVSGESVLSLP